MDDQGLATLGLRENGMRQPFFDDQPESEPVSDLCQQIRDNDPIARCVIPNRMSRLVMTVSPPAFVLSLRRADGQASSRATPRPSSYVTPSAYEA
jgi:hypothetical protein